MIINRILPIYMSLMLIFSLSFIVHLEAILNLWMKNYLCTVFWRFVSKEEAIEPNLICYQNFRRVIWGQYGSVYYDNFVVVSCIWMQCYQRALWWTCAITNHPLNSILGDPGAANWDRILTATDKVNDKNRRTSEHVILPSHFQSKGLFTWRWGTPGRWGNLLRWGNPPIHKISHFNVITFTY